LTANKDQGQVIPRLGEVYPRQVHWNSSTAFLAEKAIANEEGVFSNAGALIVDTGEHTGRSPRDKYIVDYGNSAVDGIEWGSVNQPISPERFDKLLERTRQHLNGAEVYIQDLCAGNHPGYARSFRVVTDKAWAALFSKNLLLPFGTPLDSETDFLLVHVPDLHADPAIDGTASKAFIIIDFRKQIILIGGTSYAGEIKKSVFSAMNYLLPAENVLPMHCSANIGQAQDTALFFGLSGTGKTTLSSSPDRFLIGDDEHGWGEDGTFNFEGGCYAKMIHLKKELEPLIWDACHRFGTVLENVIYDADTREIDFNSDRKTENTRGAYPLEFIEGHVLDGRGGHPRNIFFLSADAFGVLPPIALLSNEQALFYFLLGYTAKLAGTEKGLGKEPEATFSTCFGEPFLPLAPQAYGELFLQKLLKYQPNVWLINTGWSGGPYGTGKRIALPYSRAMVNWAISSASKDDVYHTESHFRLRIPCHVEGVPDALLIPETTWDDQSLYREVALTLIAKMKTRMDCFKSRIDPAILNCAPWVTV